MNIYVIFHKPFDIELPDCYSPLQVGATLNNNDFGYQKDNSGENISHKNKNYCELTGLYWIWKNTSDDIVGLCHYRRYFSSNRQIIDEQHIRNILKDYDIILPNSMSVPTEYQTVLCHYEEKHNINDLILCRKAIEDIYPEYLNSFDICMNSSLMCLGNMIITRKEILDEYCKWLFDILFIVESNTNIESYDNYQKRIYGFLSERLLRVWVMNNKYKVKEEPIEMIE